MAIIEDLILGTSKEIHMIRKLVSCIADCDATTLISGESGTGKTLAAMTIHQMSRRASDSLLQFDCAATSEKFLENELFGSEEAGKTKRGVLEASNGRTLLLENIDQAPLRLQTRLLRVFQDRTFVRCDGIKELSTDCRFIGTSQGDSAKKVQARLIREDFYYRLQVLPIQMPALRDRPEDIRPLLQEFLIRLGKDSEAFIELLQTQGLLEYFEQYSWPGNVRELKQVIETLVLTETWDSIKQLLLGHGNASNKMIIERCLEFPPEHHQAAVSILSFFGEVLRRKYPTLSATVRIEQVGWKVRMIVEPLVGKREVFESALDEFGLLLTGKMTPDSFTNDPFLANNLKLELRLAQARIESQKELLQYQEKHISTQDHRIEQLMTLLGDSLQAPQPPNVSITVSPTISSEINVNSTVSIEIIDICNDLNELSTIPGISSDDVSILKETREELEALQKSGTAPKKDSTAINKLKKLIERISDPNSTIGKTIQAAKRGVALAQGLARRYNQIAELFGWPEIPSPFL